MAGAARAASSSWSARRRSSVLPGAPAGAADPSPEGGCVIHKLKYDGAGNYVGERLTAGC